MEFLNRPKNKISKIQITKFRKLRLLPAPFYLTTEAETVSEQP
jgi:hypothetical protein